MEGLDRVVTSVLKAPSQEELLLLNIVAMLRETLDMLGSYHHVSCALQNPKQMKYGCNCHVSAIRLTYVEIEEMIAGCNEH